MESSALLPLQVSGSTSRGRFLLCFFLPRGRHVRGKTAPIYNAMVVLVKRLWLDSGSLLVACFFAGCFISPSVCSFKQATCVILTSSRGLFQAQDAVEVMNLLFVPFKGLSIGLVMGIFTLFEMKAVVFFSSRVSQGSIYFPELRHVVLHAAVALQHAGLSHQPSPCISKRNPHPHQPHCCHLPRRWQEEGEVPNRQARLSKSNVSEASLPCWVLHLLQHLWQHLQDTQAAPVLPRFLPGVRGPPEHRAATKPTRGPAPLPLLQAADQHPSGRCSSTRDQQGAPCHAAAWTSAGEGALDGRDQALLPSVVWWPWESRLVYLHWRCHEQARKSGGPPGWVSWEAVPLRHVRRLETHSPPLCVDHHPVLHHSVAGPVRPEDGEPPLLHKDCCDEQTGVSLP